VWNDNDRLLLWILVIGGIAATDFPVRDWFVSSLGTVGAELRLVHWEAAKIMLREVLLAR